MINGNILELMDSMRKQSEWISESKTRAANKTIFMFLSIWLEDTLNHSKISWRNNCRLRPKLTDMFTYQTPTTVASDAKTVEFDDDSVYNWSPQLGCYEWGQIMRDPFNKSFREKFVEYISPEESTKGHKKN